MIDQFTIQKIFDAAEIVDVVSDFITLKKRGVNYLGVCPFHNEKTPSFTVSPAKGIYKCFGCGKGGNSVNFVMEHEHLDYPSALKYIANKYNIEIVEKEETEEQKKQKGERESLMVVSGYAQKYFSEKLYNHDEGVAIGLSYFKERGLREDIIKKFNLGYCLDARDEFTQDALRNGYKLEFLEKTGLTINKNRTYDRFSGRVMFPIHTISGKVIAFGGRTLKSDKKIAKYLNSPESEIYHKSNVLYGLYQSKSAIVKEDKCFLVEGYTDVISLHQTGVENVVASSGTSLTSPQIRLIKRFTNNITILYDGDAAGIKASLRGIDLILQEGLSVKVLLFPDGEDPDSYSHKLSSTEFVEFIMNNEKDFISFKTELLMKDVKNDPVKKARLVNELVTSISIIPDKPMRAEYVSVCSNLLRVDEAMLHYEVNKLLGDGSVKKSYDRNVPEPVPTKSDENRQIFSGKLEEEEKAIIRLLLNYCNQPLFSEDDEQSGGKVITVAEYIVSELEGDDLVFNNKSYNDIIEEYKKLLASGAVIDDKYFINHPNSAFSKLAADFLSQNNKLSKMWNKNEAYLESEEMRLKEFVPKSVVEYKQKFIISTLKDIESQMANCQENGDTETLMELMQKHLALNEYKKILSKELGDRIIL